MPRTDQASMRTETGSAAHVLAPSRRGFFFYRRMRSHARMASVIVTVASPLDLDRPARQVKIVRDQQHVGHADNGAGGQHVLGGNPQHQIGQRQVRTGADRTGVCRESRGAPSAREMTIGAGFPIAKVSRYRADRDLPRRVTVGLAIGRPLCYRRGQPGGTIWEESR